MTLSLNKLFVIVFCLGLLFGYAMPDLCAWAGGQ